MRETPQRMDRFELPTIGVAVAIYGGFLLLTWYFTVLPLWLAASLGAVLLAWHGSLQHETIHGHPTPWRRVNGLIGGVPLSLWIPYPLYRQSHMRHHRFGGHYLTDPFRDPESFYLPSGSLASLSAPGRWLARANCTLAGRMLVGPLLTIGAFFAAERQVLGTGNWRWLWIWMRHAFGAAAVLGWVVGVCRIPPLIYVGLFIYPGTSLSLLRSFAEHRAGADAGVRTAVVEAHPFWGLIFLNNNLHIAHHTLPRVPWYRLPRVWRDLQSSDQGVRAADAGMVYRGGYRQILRAFLLRPVIAVEHPASVPMRT